ncbi:ROK family protein [Amorphoplanes digitatis]|uniref:Putative NBD/HSP70 family sugar kinase n=1 Tax=Actinoplanes digitatis TaxID=1868 RepID=A0A7W7HRM1_9ACTN|nr:ROK family protein [Actinoplanes digitatis]MBB4759527.1 putative NBD/HSP70 family sugar kinase [Actinoplanes digitatis]GID94924.1 xylose repressor [Actinoplanes digitatis]
MTTRATELLRVVHARPGVTRADAARMIGVGTGAATELVGRLGQAQLLAEGPTAPSGARGRPTTALIPHPRGPLIAAASITHESWRVDVVELGGSVLATAGENLAGRGGDEVVAALGAAVQRLRQEHGDRIRGIGISVPGTVSRDLMLDASQLGWHDVDLAVAWPRAETFVAGNDATLAASAESRRGVAVGASVALHLRIEAGLGGAVVDGGKVLIGALGASGEFGHMPFGDPAVRCPCGAYGCWGTAVDGSALARLLGHAAPRDPVSYARRIINSPEPGPVAATAAVATALGRGIAGLVNGLDADLVTLGGLGVDLLAAAPEQIAAAYGAGLMDFRRAAPPPVLPALLGDDGPIAGAAEEAWTALLTRLV